MGKFLDEAAGANAIAQMVTGFQAQAGRRPRIVAITGAGISTDSGLPDYRGTGSSGIPTVDFNQFVEDEAWQRWVWQRNQETWKAVLDLKPTLAHQVLAKWEKAGLVNGVATQNVDDLHQRAGSKRVYELHGTFQKVQCLGCGRISDRMELDKRLRLANPTVKDDPDPAHVAILAQADWQAAKASTFQTVPCEKCGGLLKPAIVFFSENLPADALEGSFALARQADIALVVGTSLAVLTGLWVVREAWGTGSKLVIINRGRTAADSYADIRVEGGASQTLQLVDQILSAEKYF